MASLPVTAPVVVVLRHPDYPNEFQVYEGVGLPIVLDVDLGSSFDGVAEDDEQFAEWRADAMDNFDCTPGITRDHPAFNAYVAAVDSADPREYR